jgi:hypothetical protein
MKLDLDLDKVYESIRDSVWKVGINFNSKDQKRFVCNIKDDSIFIPRKGMIKNFNGVFEVSRINDLIRNKVLENLINEKNSI